MVQNSGLAMADILSNDSKSSSLRAATGIGSDKVSNQSGGGSRRMTTLGDLESKLINNNDMRMTGVTARGLEHEVNKRNNNDKP